MEQPVIECMGLILDPLDLIPSGEGTVLDFLV